MQATGIENREEEQDRAAVMLRSNVELLSYRCSGTSWWKHLVGCVGIPLREEVSWSEGFRNNQSLAGC